MASIANTGAFDASLVLNSATEKAWGQIATDFSVKVVTALAQKYGFNPEEAIEFLGLKKISVVRGSKAKKCNVAKEVKASRDIPKIILPWTGTEMGGDFCHGLRLNHGLHSQCTMAKCDGEIYCKTCQRQADKNSSGTPTYGNIESRKAVGTFEFRDPKDNKLTIPYANVMEKLGVSRDQAEAEASRFGQTIPEEHFVKREAKRGRPATKPTADSDGSDTTSPKKRGRPKKEKKVIESSVGDDLIASLVAQSQQQQSNSDTSGDEDSAIPSTKVKVTKVKVVKLTEEQKAAKKTEATEKRAKVKAAKKAEKENTKNAKKAAELAAMKAKMLAMQKEVEVASAKIVIAAADKPPSPDVELEIEEITEVSPTKEKSRATFQSPKPTTETKASNAEPSKEKPSTTSIEKDEYEGVSNSMLADSDDEGTIVPEDEDDDEEEVKVVKFEHDGKNYLRATDNMLYDPATSECVGCWNPASKEIEEVAEFGSDEEDESDDEN